MVNIQMENIMGKFIDLTGQKFNRLTVTSIAPHQFTSGGNKMVCFYCVCECGNNITVRAVRIKNNHTKSCGCLRHEMSKSTEYKSWSHIKERCCNPNSKSFHRYGARGIKVCDRWLESFENFFNDMGEKPSKQHSIDRIDNNKGYFPENCRWATPMQQANNTRNTIFLEFYGTLKPLSYWCDYFNINKGNVISRRHKKKINFMDSFIYFIHKKLKP